VQLQIVTPEYFGALGIPLLQGRLLTDVDREGGLPVAVIDESMAAQFWPGEDPIGKRVSFESPPGTPDGSPDRLYRTVVGVVKNVRHYELETPSRIQIYVAAHQSGQAWTRSMQVLVGTRADPRMLSEPLRQQVAAIDGDVPFSRVQTMEGYLDAALGQTRIVGRLLTLFSGLAAGLAGLGLFSVLAYTVAQRVREIGVRVALGASSRQVVGLVAGQGMRLALTGIVIGLGAAFGLTRLLRSVLFEVQPVDAATFSATAGGLLLIALAAAVVPARRAARTDPAVVLREE
jgi:predicted permease